MKNVIVQKAEQTRDLYRTNKITIIEAKTRLKDFSMHFNNVSKRLGLKYGVKPNKFILTTYLNS